jgi:hypothetical protein
VSGALSGIEAAVVAAGYDANLDAAELLPPGSDRSIFDRRFGR